MKLTITAKDQTEAGDYRDNDNCLVATILKRLGYKKVRVNPIAATVDGREFEIQNFWNINEKLYNKKATRVLKSAIGKKIELVEVA